MIHVQDLLYKTSDDLARRHAETLGTTHRLFKLVIADAGKRPAVQRDTVFFASKING